MANYLSEIKTDLSSRMIRVEVYKTAAHHAPLLMFAEVRDADQVARQMSEWVAAEGGYVRLIDEARIRATYRNGDRVKSTPMTDFYQLTEQEAEDARIWCSKTCEWF